LFGPASVYRSKKTELTRHLKTESTARWLALLEPADIWCAEVLDWQRLTTHPAYQALDMEQTVYRSDGLAMKTTRLPIRFDGERFASAIGSPKVGEHTKKIVQEFCL
jgi:CoA:oxalate CoA-transferase